MEIPYSGSQTLPWSTSPLGDYAVLRPLCRRPVDCQPASGGYGPAHTWTDQIGHPVNLQDQHVHMSPWDQDVSQHCPSQIPSGPLVEGYTAGYQLEGQNCGDIWVWWCNGRVVFGCNHARPCQWSVSVNSVVQKKTSEPQVLRITRLALRLALGFPRPRGQKLTLWHFVS